MTKFLFTVLLILFPFFCSHAGEHIVLYRMGNLDAPQWNTFKKYLVSKGYKVSMYDGEKDIGKHVTTANKVNRERAAAFFAMEFNSGQAVQTLIAVAEARKPKGKFVAIEEVPAVHLANSKELATALATAYRTRFIRLPLFPLLGIDMPGVFVRLESPDGSFNGLFDHFHEGLQNYFGRIKEK